eukprot:957964-Lingulodinium_polyedra.AAC.1
MVAHGDAAPGAAAQAAQRRLLSEAASLDQARRGLGLSGDRALEAIAKTAYREQYHPKAPKRLHVAIQAELLAEPGDACQVPMLDALPPDDRAYYEAEENVVDPCGIPDELLAELEERFAFVGGTHEEYVSYFRRPDLPKGMWRFRPAREARATAGFSAVLKKDGVRQRKLLMAVTTNAQWSDPRRRRALGLHGGAALASMHVPGDRWEFAAFDADNAFTRVATPPWMWPWMA